MTTIAFNPSLNGAPPFTSQVTLDGNTYTLVATWSIYRVDWNVALYDNGGNLIMFQPLVGSPPGSAIALFPSLFTTSTISFVPSTGNFVITP